MTHNFLRFFILIAVACFSSAIDSWLLQFDLDGEINVASAAFRTILIVFFLVFLWGRSPWSFIAPVIYVAAEASLHSFWLARYLLGIADDALFSAIRVTVTLILILSAIGALTLLGLDYLDYRRKRVK